MDKYYKYEDKIVNSFLFVPKFLFSDERFMKLSVTEKLIYSLYLHRYTISQYHDEIGRYIILLMMMLLTNFTSLQGLVSELEKTRRSKSHQNPKNSNI